MTVARRNGWQFLRGWWSRLLHASQRAPRQLRLAESLALGDRRFVAVIEVAEARYLVGGTPTSLVLLAELESAQSALPSASLDALGNRAAEEPR